MIKRIIVEGADQQGKSTLCKILADRLGWEVKHFGKPSEDFNFIADYIVPEYTISDRNFLSEIVYSMVKNVKSRAQFMLLDNIFKNKETLLIVMDREDYFVFDSSRHEDYTYKAIVQAIELYRKVYRQISFEKIMINPNEGSFLSNVEHIITKITQANEDIQEP